MLTIPDTPLIWISRRQKGWGCSRERGNSGRGDYGSAEWFSKGVHSDPCLEIALTGADSSKVNNYSVNQGVFALRNWNELTTGMKSPEVNIKYSGNAQTFKCSQITSINTESCGINWMEHWWIYTSVALLKQTGALLFCCEKESHRNLQVLKEKCVQKCHVERSRFCWG